MRKHTILLTYDLVSHTEVDLGIENLRSLYASGCRNETFKTWTPERFAMQVQYADGNRQAYWAAIETAVLALYKIRPRSRISNLKIWHDGMEEMPPAPSNHNAQPATT